MSITPTANVWARGQDLLVLSIAFGIPAPGTGIVSFGGNQYLQNKGAGQGSPVFPTTGSNPVSAVAIRGNCDYLRIAGRYMLDQIIALDATTDNFTEILQSCDVSVAEVMKQSGNILPYGYWATAAATGSSGNASYCQITALMGNALHGRGYLLTMQREGIGDGMVNFGKNTIEMTLKPADLGYPCVQYIEY